MCYDNHDNGKRCSLTSEAWYCLMHGGKKKRGKKQEKMLWKLKRGKDEKGAANYLHLWTY